MSSQDSKQDRTSGAREPDAGLEVQSTRTEGELVITVDGELDMATVGQLEAELLQAEASDAKTIVLDLSGLRFMDSTGLSLILSADARSRGNGRRLRLLRGGEAVQSVFTITRTDERLPFVN